MLRARARTHALFLCPPSSSKSSSFFVFEEMVIRIRCSPGDKCRAFIAQVLLPLRLVLAASRAIHRLISGILLPILLRRIRIILSPRRKRGSLTPQLISPCLRTHHPFFSPRIRLRYQLVCCLSLSYPFESFFPHAGNAVP